MSAAMGFITEAGRSAYRALVPEALRLRARDRRFAFHYRRHRLYRGEVRGRELKFSTRDEYSKQWFYPRYLGGVIHEPEISLLLADLLEGKSCFADVGMHLGWFTCLAGVVCPEAEIFGFEMDRDALEIARLNIELNGHGRTCVSNLAVSDGAGVVSFYKSLAGPCATASLGRGGTGDGPEHRREIETVALDEFFAGRDRLPGVLKVDVEGAEMRVLRGMAGILEKARPAMILELHPAGLERQGSSLGELCKFLEEHGYTIDAIERDETVPRGYRRTRIEGVASWTENTHVCAEARGD